MLPITRVLNQEQTRLELLNTLDPEQVQDYAERSCRWVNNSEINQFLGREGTTMENTLKWYRTRPSEIETDRTFAIWVNETHVGNCGIHTIDAVNGHACLGILIGDVSLHNKGIGTQTMTALCKHAFIDLGLRKLWLHVVGHNMRGIRCYQKCGFVEVGRKRDHYFRAGELRDEVTMELHSDSFGLSEQQLTERAILHIVKKSLK